MQSHNQGALEQPRATPHHATSNQTPHQGPYFENNGTQTFVPPHAHPVLASGLDALEGFKHTEFDVADLCLFSNIVIPPKFELPTFNKYKGTTCPKGHLTMYCRKMAPHTHDNALLIHVFQEILTRASLGWYLGLRREHIPTGRSLEKGFLNQYKYNIDMALNYSQLQNMVKGEREAFKGNAQHWRELVAHIQPLLSKKKMVTMFIDTLHSPFYEKMVGNVSSYFLDLLLIGERVEVGMKKGKIVPEADTSHTNKPHDGKEEEEANLTANLQLSTP
ncbi:hypothetical protein CR513_46677, partial [Mucuna pruriens]